MTRLRRLLLGGWLLLATAQGAEGADWGHPPGDPDRPLAEDRYTPPAPRRWYLGLGAAHADISSNYPAIGDHRTSGTDLLGGLEFARTWSVEMYVSLNHQFATAATDNIYYPPDRASYGLVAFTLRKRLWDLDARGWSPWLAAGLGVGTVEWETYFYNLTGGLTPVFAGGVDVALGKWPLAVRLQWLHNAFSARDTYDYGPYQVKADITGAALVWRSR